MIEDAFFPARCIKNKYFVLCVAARYYVLLTPRILYAWGCDGQSVALLISSKGYKFFAQYNIVVALAVPGAIRHIILTVIRLVYFVNSRNCLGKEVLACVYCVFVTNARIDVIGLVAAISYKA
mgnify:CR=1 FL=1